jgi:transposase InsO family protein
MGCGLSKAHSNPEVLVSHGSARTTFHGRLLIVQRHRAGWPQAHIAAAMGVSRKCVKTWVDRYAAEGPSGLHDRSSRPHSLPTRTAAATESVILQLRRSQRLGPDEIGHRLGVPARTVSRVLARHGVPRLSMLDPITGQVIRASKATTLRYEHPYPGSLVHMDVKKLGRIPVGGGWRAHGRSMGRSRARRLTVVGYDYVHSMVDDYSRLAYSEVLPDEKGPTCAAFLERALAYFTAHGITRVERLMTDNAFAYRYSLRQVCADHGQIKQVFIKPHCPWQNGKVERLNRTLLVEWAYRQVFTTNDQRTAALAPWLEHYNTGRRHSALGGHPPISRLRPT